MIFVHPRRDSKKSFSLDFGKAETFNRSRDDRRRKEKSFWIEKCPEREKGTSRKKKIDDTAEKKEVQLH